MKRTMRQIIMLLVIYVASHSLPPITEQGGPAEALSGLGNHQLLAAPYPPLNDDASLEYSTYLGGSSTETGQISVSPKTSALILNTAQVDDGLNPPFTLTVVSAINPRRILLPLVQRGP